VHALYQLKPADSLSASHYPSIAPAPVVFSLE
jgi:hypothetical protein